MAIEVGSVLEGVVTGITNFGAFVELEEGKTGLVHIMFTNHLKIFHVENEFCTQDLYILVLSKKDIFHSSKYYIKTFS